MKVGSYGTGGRTYTHTRVRRKGENSGREAVGFCSFIFVALLIFMGYTEVQTNRDLSAIGEIANQASSLPEGQAGIDALTAGSSSAEGRLVHLSGVAASAAEATVDDAFSVTFENAATVKRNAEYCQWREIRHETTRKVGEDSEGNDIEETEVSFSYVLGWQSHLINSVFFDNPVAYHNPQRDPVPSYTTHARALLGEEPGVVPGSGARPGSQQLSVGAGQLYVGSAEAWRVPADMGISPRAASEGFDRHDGRFLYSPYEKSPLFAVGHAAASYFVDGVIDTGLGGVCTPGDIRVSFDVARFPSTVSVIATLSNGELVPTKTSNGRELLLSHIGSKTVKQVADREVEERESWRNLVRGLTAAGAIIWAIIVIMHRRDAAKAAAEAAAEAKQQKAQ